MHLLARALAVGIDNAKPGWLVSGAVGEYRDWCGSTLRPGSCRHWLFPERRASDCPLTTPTDSRLRAQPRATASPLDPAAELAGETSVIWAPRAADQLGPRSELAVERHRKGLRAEMRCGLL